MSHFRRFVLLSLLLTISWWSSDFGRQISFTKLPSDQAMREKIVSYKIVSAFATSQT